MRSTNTILILAMTAVVIGCSSTPRRLEKRSDSQKKATRQTWMGTKVAAPKHTAAKMNVLDLGAGVKMKLVLIPKGKFSMGSATEGVDEKPLHEVRISKPFYMGVTEVTQVQYQTVMGSNPSNWKGGQLPVEKVSWYETVSFCKKLSSKTGRTVRLPSEAEWEYACRAGTTTKYSFGDDASRLGEYAWYRSNSDRKAHAVGQKKPNPWGLHDMHGNVWEWCLDHWNDSYSGAPNGGSAWTSGDANIRVLRGGSWDFEAKYCRSASRGYYNPTYRDYNSGFRVIVSFSRTQ